MDTLLVKIFATALTFSQVATAPDAVKTRFDPSQDRQQAVDLLRAGCAQVRKAFDIESVKLDDLIAIAMDDPDAIAASRAEFRGINIGDLLTAYRQFCKNETIANSPVDLGAVIETSPSIDLSTSGLAGTGGIDASVSAPTAIGVSADVGHLDVGGLLHGLI